MARPGWVTAWQASVWCGRARVAGRFGVPARPPFAFQFGLVEFGTAWLGAAGYGQASPGGARHGEGEGATFGRDPPPLSDRSSFQEPSGVDALHHRPSDRHDERGDAVDATR
jgi:hypothetical protein